MRRISICAAFVIGMLLACAVPPTAAPQSVVPFKQVLATPGGDTLPVFGTFRFTLDIDSVHVKHAPAETVKVTVRDTLVPQGLPFGPINLFSGASYRWGRNYGGVFSLHDGSVPNPILPIISVARGNRVKLLLNMTGGSHSKYITNGKFDLAKWKDIQRAFDTPQNQQAIADGVADGTIIGADMVDEANHPTWGGWFSKARLDTMAVFVKSIFPTLPTGLIIQYDWMPDSTYKKIDFIISQYSARKGDLAAYRAGAVAAAKKNGVKLIFSVNWLDFYAAANGCPIPLTGGPGSTGGDAVTGTIVKGCRITPLAFEQTSISLGITPEICALLGWTNDTTMLDQKAYQEAAVRVRRTLGTYAGTKCTRAG